MIVLITWKAPIDPYDHYPDVAPWNKVVLDILGSIHIICSVILVTGYFLSNPPIRTRVISIFFFFFEKKKNDDNTNVRYFIIEREYQESFKFSNT